MSDPTARAVHFEKKLGDALTEAGLLVVPEFAIDVDDGKKFSIDWYIPFPRRAVVESKVFGAGGGFGSDVWRRVDRVIRQLFEVRKAFEGQLLCFLVLFDPDKIIDTGELDRRYKFSETWLYPIIVSGPTATNDAASLIRKKLFAELKDVSLSSLTRSDLTESLSSTGVLWNVLVNFRSRISPGAFNALVKEAEGLSREYGSAHYTTAALYVGRAIEYVVYTLARDFEVPINKRTVGVLQALNESFNQFSRSLIEYAYSETEDEKSHLHINLQKSSDVLQAMVSQSTTLIQQSQEKSVEDAPLNLHSLLKDVGRKFSHIDGVSKEIKIINKFLGKTLGMRNRAAHADVSGGRTEYNKMDVDGMMEQFRTILFHLGNIVDAIRENEFSSGESEPRVRE